MTDTIAPKVVQVTAEGLEELRAELNELVNVKLPAAIARVAKAREYGDLAENSEYHSARDDQALLEARISEIEEVIAHAQVVSNTKSHTHVGMGSVVVVAIKGAKKQKTFHIVGEYEADPAESKISSTSPLGQALVGKKKGDVVMVDAPAGKIEYQIIEIK
jgi:transcription elongation factor GreA